MAYSGKYSGCKAFVYADGKEAISKETTIAEYNSTKLIVFINGSLPEFKENDKVSLLLFLPKSLIEFQGIIRKIDTQGNREITLFKGHEKESREEKRYDMNAWGIVEGLCVGDSTVPIIPGVNLLIVNISKGGVLVRMQAGLLNIGTSFRFRIEVSGRETILNACVKRIRILEDKEVEYGCILTSKV